MKLHLVPLRILQNRAGFVPTPSWCTYLVCNRCNARCQMCDSWKMPKGKELTPSEVSSVFGKLGSLDVVRVSGGEPFLRDDLLEVTESIMRASSPGVLHITTNGSFPERVERLAKRFSRPKRLHFMVSVDGLPEEHNASRGKAVTFERVVDTVKRLVALRERGLDVSINHTVISNRSLEDGPEVQKLFGRLGVDVQSVLAYEDSAMYGLSRRGKRSEDLAGVRGYPLHSALCAEAAYRFVKAEMVRVDQVKNPFLKLGKRYYLSGLERRLAGEPNPQPSPRCVALRSHVRLLPDGRIPVCQFNTETVGNLLEEEFEAIWQKGSAKTHRAWVDACEGCWAECEVVPNAIYSGDILRAVAGT